LKLAAASWKAALPCRLLDAQETMRDFPLARAAAAEYLSSRRSDKGGSYEK